MTPKLLILNGENSGKKVKLPEDEAFLIGRDQACDLCLNERKVSRQHTRIFFDTSESKVFLEDLESLNGTFVNSEPVRSCIELKQDDQIRIGSHLLQFFSVNSSKLDSSIPQVSRSHSQLTDSGQPADFFDHEISDSRQNEASLSEFSHLDMESEVDRATGGRILTGKLSELSLPDVIQMLATTRKSGVLTISKTKLLYLPKTPKTEIAKIYIQNGELLYAYYHGVEGEEAFYQSLEIQDGYFALFPLHEVDLSAPIEAPLEMMLLEGLRKLDEKKANQQTLIESDTLEAVPSESLSGLSSEELKIFQLAWKHKKVEQVLKFSHLNKNETLEIIRKLLRSNVLKKS